MPNLLPKELMYNDNTPYVHNKFKNFNYTIKDHGGKAEFSVALASVKRKGKLKIKKYYNASRAREDEVISTAKTTRDKFLKSFNLKTASKEFKTYGGLKNFNFGKYATQDATDRAFYKRVALMQSALNNIVDAKNDYDKFRNFVLNAPNNAKSQYNRYEKSLDKITESVTKIAGKKEYSKEEWSKFIREMSFPTGWLFEPLANNFVENALGKIFPKEDSFNLEVFGDKLSKFTTADIRLTLGSKTYGIDVKSNVKEIYSNTRVYNISDFSVLKENPFIQYVYVNNYYMKALGKGKIVKRFDNKLNKLIMIEAAVNSIVGTAYQANAANEILLVFPTGVHYMSDFFKSVMNKIERANFAKERFGKIGPSSKEIQRQIESQAQASLGLFKELYRFKLKQLEKNKSGGYHTIVQSIEVSSRMRRLYKNAKKAKVTYHMNLFNLWK